MKDNQHSKNIYFIMFCKGK